MEPNSQSTPIPKMPALLLTWRWLCGLSYAIFGLTVWLALRFFPGITDSPWPAPVSVLLLLVAMGLPGGLGWWYAGQRYVHYQAEHHAGYGVMLASGVWWRSEVWVPIMRLQHIDVNQGPLDRRWGMATLSLYTAGTHENEIRIKGLPVEQAHALRQILLPVERGPHE